VSGMDETYAAAVAKHAEAVGAWDRKYTEVLEQHSVVVAGWEDKHSAAVEVLEAKHAAAVAEMVALKEEHAQVHRASEARKTELVLALQRASHKLKSSRQNSSASSSAAVLVASAQDSKTSATRAKVLEGELYALRERKAELSTQCQGALGRVDALSIALSDCKREASTLTRQLATARGVIAELQDKQDQSVRVQSDLKRKNLHLDEEMRLAELEVECMGHKVTASAKALQSISMVSSAYADDVKRRGSNSSVLPRAGDREWEPTGSAVKTLQLQHELEALRQTHAQTATQLSRGGEAYDRLQGEYQQVACYVVLCVVVCCV
jgi:chromosome segregation ATPase